ncbi:MAG: hypothetical protein C0395_04455, partial [Gemmatimonas sp.]|nr:hypothetical protein [Gemmatimonas sp.]
FTALLRGINVGRAKRIAMADLRRLFADLGYADVRTLLNSGNVVFAAKSPDAAGHARTIRAAIEREFSLTATVIVVTAADLAAILLDNPLRDVADDPARHLVAFVQSPVDLAAARPMLARAWSPEAFALGQKAAYLWCAGGVADSEILKTFMRYTGETATTRNRTTASKILAIAGEGVRPA